MRAAETTLSAGDTAAFREWELKFAVACSLASFAPARQMVRSRGGRFDGGMSVTY
jgi:hypothetical protein